MISHLKATIEALLLQTHYFFCKGNQA